MTWEEGKPVEKRPCKNCYHVDKPPTDEGCYTCDDDYNNYKKR